MSLNLIGVAAAAATFVGVWLGHVCVRKVEFNSRSLATPMLLAALTGVVLEVAAMLVPSRIASATLGILGMTVLWDVLEFRRQARRVAVGHAPANPANPRHARLLASGAATTTDWLRREPSGRPLRADELDDRPLRPDLAATPILRRRGP